jgi:hypothetical protein
VTVTLGPCPRVCILRIDTSLARPILAQPSG